MVPFEAVIAIPTDPLSAAALYVTLGLKFPERGWIAPQPVTRVGVAHDADKTVGE
jgi:hypothetical protein